ncbi:MAG TPA: ABC transporter permease [Candidatus Egerieimonas intestinavium]|uniref:ABC transporter permease n=1 Tax=Candidatus Egerieimonas intestinavium TaxID=2840777 RepID=A0A9D1EKH7_9FIRM|nr:ABC transporter permease [Candidatus Egerieimonas intestinavium]
MNEKKKKWESLPESVKVETKARIRERKIRIFISVTAVTVFLLIWYLAVKLAWIDPKYVASPWEVVSTFVKKFYDITPDGATMPVHFWASLQVVLVGFISAIIVGIPLGLLTGYYRVADDLITPIFEIIRPIPPLAWTPLAIIWMGLGSTAKSFLIFLAAFVPCVINSYTGVRLTNPVRINVAKTFGASKWEIFRTVCVPSALPMVFAGVKIAIGNAWTTVVAAELLASAAGLGYMIQQGRTYSRSDVIIVGMFAIGITGSIFSWAVGKLESKLVPWRKQ